MAISTLVTSVKEAQKVRILDRVFCIHYLMHFPKDNGKNILALFDSENKLNAMTPAYAAQLGLKVQKINDGTQKINRSLLATYPMVIAAFQVFDKLDRF